MWDTKRELILFLRCEEWIIFFQKVLIKNLKKKLSLKTVYL